MSVYEREPKIPRDDTGKGLRITGWMLLTWTAFSMVWMPARVRSTGIAVIANAACFGVGVFLVLLGYVMSWLTPYETALTESTHDLMSTTHSGQQLEEPLFANTNGPGLEPTRLM